VYEKGECEGSETRSEQRVISDENGNCWRSIAIGEIGNHHNRRMNFNLTLENIDNSYHLITNTQSIMSFSRILDFTHFLTPQHSLNYIFYREGIMTRIFDPLQSTITLWPTVFSLIETTAKV
jgi:hypothetical protein